MNIVIQCAGSKRADAGCMKRRDGTPVLFVAKPARAPASSLGSHPEYVRPDDLEDDGTSWRETLVDYNKSADANPWGLLRAGDLYAPSAYRKLVDRFGIAKIFILSAGWGMVRGSFLLPAYDITFSGSAEQYKRRPRTAVWSDFDHLPDDETEPTVFFGGKDYLPLFSSLTAKMAGRRVVFYNSDLAPEAVGCELHRYPTSMKTNWHYRCALDLAEGRLSLPPLDEKA